MLASAVWNRGLDLWELLDFSGALLALYADLNEWCDSVDNVVLSSDVHGSLFGVELPLRIGVCSLLLGDLACGGT
jgi:hypothetical protein